MQNINKVRKNSRPNPIKPHRLTEKYLGIYLPDPGEIPYDEQIDEALKSFLPVSVYAPTSPAALALADNATKLGKVIDLFLRKRSTGGAHVQ